VVVADAVEHTAVVFLEDARKTLDHADRRAQVVRHGVAEGRLLAEQLGRLSAFQHQAGRGGHRCGAGARRAHVAFELALGVEARHAAQQPVAVLGRAHGPYRHVGQRHHRLQLCTQAVCIGDEPLPQRLAAPVTMVPGRGRRAGRRLQAQQAVVAIGLPLPHIEQLDEQLALGTCLAQRLALALAFQPAAGDKTGQRHQQQRQTGKEPQGGAGHFAGDGHARDCK
jgi:hypothetical protein